MQTSLGQFSADRHLITYWIEYVRNMPPIPGAYRDPLVEISTVGYDGADTIRIEFFCRSQPPENYDWYLRCRHEIFFPEIMSALYPLAHALIRDGFVIEQWGIPGYVSAPDYGVEPILVAYRWIEDEEITGLYQYHMSPGYPWGHGRRHYVPIECGRRGGL